MYLLGAIGSNIGMVHRVWAGSLVNAVTEESGLRRFIQSFYIRQNWRH